MPYYFAYDAISPTQQFFNYYHGFTYTGFYDIIYAAITLFSLRFAAEVSRFTEFLGTITSSLRIEDKNYYHCYHLTTR